VVKLPASSSSGCPITSRCGASWAEMSEVAITDVLEGLRKGGGSRLWLKGEGSKGEGWKG